MALSEGAKRVKEMIVAVIKRRPDLKSSVEKDTWGRKRTWMIGKVRCTKERGLPVESLTHKYLTSMSLGPKKIWGQVRQKNLVLRHAGDTEYSRLDSRTVASLPFWLPWQKQYTKRFHRSLVQSGQTLDKLCADLKRLSGDEARRRLQKIPVRNAIPSASTFSSGKHFASIAFRLTVM